MPTTEKIYGAKLEQNDLDDFFPIDNSMRDFNHFLFRHIKNTAGAYYLEIWAVDKNNIFIRQIPLTQDAVPTQLTFVNFDPLDIKIGITRQLARIPVSSGNAIKFLKLTPKVFMSNHISYDVQIRVGTALVDYYKNINPRPPASPASNDW